MGGRLPRPRREAPRSGRRPPSACPQRGPASPARGSGSRRLFYRDDLPVIRVLQQLMSLGAGLPVCAPVIHAIAGLARVDWDGRLLVVYPNGRWYLDGPIVAAAWVVNLSDCLESSTVAA